LKTLSVVIPVYNETELIEELIGRTNKVLLEMAISYEILLVDDGSVDDSWAKITSLKARFPNLKSIKFSRNFGHHYAISAGLREVTGDFAVVMDGDLQDRPEVIPKLFQKIHEGFDVVFVARENRPESKLYLLLQRIYYFVLNTLSGLEFNSKYANFSIINRKVIDSFNLLSENTRFYGSSILWLGYRKGEVSAQHGTRFAGKPSYTISKRIRLALDVIIAFSDRPLKFAIYLGITQALVSIIFVANLVSKYFLGSNSESIQEIILASIFLSTGIIVLILGLIGIYIGRIYRETKMRPLFLISERID
jgi:glycosyltransferase involved in cell wall biosynthesis